MTQGLKTISGVILVDPTTGVPAGVIGADGKEYLIATTPNGQAAVLPSPYVPAAVAITGGSVNNTPIGATTPSTVKTSNLQAGVNTDISGTPGNGTSSGTRGRAAFAAAASTITVTSTLVTAASTVIVQLGGSDATLTSVRVTAAAGSFTVTGNAAATASTPFDFLVIN
jgi:hypothetical protein